jgi:hypothetical protein
MHPVFSAFGASAAGHDRSEFTMQNSAMTSGGASGVPEGDAVSRFVPSICTFQSLGSSKPIDPSFVSRAGAVTDVSSTANAAAAN